MSIALLKYDLSDPDDRLEFERASKSLDMALSIWEFAYNSRKTIENELDADADSRQREYDLLDKVYTRFWEILNEHDISPDKLVV
jgi:hypothetical protein